MFFPRHVSAIFSKDNALEGSKSTIISEKFCTGIPLKISKETFLGIFTGTYLSVSPGTLKRSSQIAPGKVPTKDFSKNTLKSSTNISWILTKGFPRRFFGYPASSSEIPLGIFF